MLAALLTNLGQEHGLSDGWSWRRRRRKTAPIAVVEQAVEEAPELQPLWDHVRFDQEIEARLAAAMHAAHIEILASQQRAEIAALLRAIAEEIDDEEALLFLQ